jgi:hypothetical protein
MENWSAPTLEIPVLSAHCTVDYNGIVHGTRNVMRWLRKIVDQRCERYDQKYANGIRHAAALVAMGRFSGKVHGAALALQVPVVGWAPLKSLEHLGPAAVVGVPTSC